MIPPVNHIILIPLILALGVFIGWNIGTNQVRKEWDKAERKRQRDEA